MKPEMLNDAPSNMPESKVPAETILITFTEAPLGLGYGSIHTPESTVDDANERAKRMKDFFFEVPGDTPSDCIDGRHSLSLLNGAALEAPRPGVAGGAGVTGYAAAELTNYFGNTSFPVEEKFVTIVERLEDNSGGAKVIKVGGHVDKDAVENDYDGEKTGCGAADKFLANLALLSMVNVTFTDSKGEKHTESDNEKNTRIKAVKTLAKAVYDAAGYYSADVEQLIEDIMHTATHITEKATLAGWNGVVMKDTIEEKGQDRLVVLDTSAGGVHGHTERKVLFNFIKDTTFDQDDYYDATQQQQGEGREIFDIDVWHIHDISEKLADSPDEHQASKLFAAGIAFQIATYLGLCDGSHRAFFAQQVQ